MRTHHASVILRLLILTTILLAPLMTEPLAVNYSNPEGADSRENQSKALADIIRRKLPAGAMWVIGGDPNTRSTDERCFTRLARAVAVPVKPPDDGFGNIATNAPRNRPYDWILASPSVDRHAVPVVLAGRRFPNGLVFDSRVFEPLKDVPPVQRNDSGVKNMQHMAVVRDFRIP
jgi:hypothetical protein